MEHIIPDAAAEVLNELARLAHRNAVEHGFYAEYYDLMATLERAGADMRLMEAAERDFTLAQIAKIASECGEAVHAIQHGEQPECIVEELADVVIRIFDLCGRMDADVGRSLTGKMARNRCRPYKHGKLC